MNHLRAITGCPRNRTRQLSAFVNGAPIKGGELSSRDSLELLKGLGRSGEAIGIPLGQLSQNLTFQLQRIEVVLLPSNSQGALKPVCGSFVQSTDAVVIRCKF